MIENKNRNAEEARSIQVAEESRELDWKSKSFIASLFMGDLDIRLAEDPADKVLGDEICARVDAWARENIDGEEIDRTEEIPAHVWKGLAELGLFGIKIPKKYGGLGMSQSNYMRILGVIARYCASVCATLSAHQSIGVPQPLKLFGTDEQKQKYLPRFARGEVSAFAPPDTLVWRFGATCNKDRGELNNAVEEIPGCMPCWHGDWRARRRSRRTAAR